MYKFLILLYLFSFIPRFTTRILLKRINSQIKKYKTTDASVHDAQVLDDLLDEKDKDEIIAKYEMKNQVHEKGYRNKPLTEEQKAN